MCQAYDGERKFLEALAKVAEPSGVERIAELETALRAIITHCETHSDGSWAEDEPWVIAKRALGDPAKAAQE